MERDPRLILTTCGRRLLGEPGAAGDDHPTHRAGLELLAGAVEERLLAAGPGEAAGLSPELNALLALNGGVMGDGGDFHVLVHSDARADALAARLIGGWLRGRGQGVVIHAMPGLRSGEAVALQRGLADFTRWCGEILARYRLHQFHVIFNPAGGSPVLGGMLQTLAPFYADEAIFLLEPGTELARLVMPRVRLRDKKVFTRHFFCLRRLAAGLPITPEKLSGLDPDLLLFDERGIGLSYLGELLWDAHHREFYGDRLLDPVSDLLILADPFRDAVVGLQRDRLELLNERLDQLALFLEGERSNPAQLSFRAMADPRLPATHQCHGWTDQAIWHLVGHYEGDRFVLDSLEKS
ncbi:MAG: hypothetical protein HQL82_06020 [Magnetococcales bacterium]|nr:hypothetical protein [Magnetococcales bacterium]